MTIRAAQHRGLSRMGFALPLLTLAAALVSSVYLAVIFSPLLLLLALYCSDRRIYESLVDFVLALGARRPRAPRTAGTLNCSHGFRPTCSGVFGVAAARPPPPLLAN